MHKPDRIVKGLPLKEYQRQWRKGNVRAYKKQRAWANRNRGKVRSSQRKHYHVHKEELKIKRQLLRSECYKAYGNACSCCGENREEFFTIDHINGRKNAPHRRGDTGKALYKWLKSHGFPKDEFRLLCFNCNCARGFRGYCPHEKERENYKFWIAAD